jgi:ABC-type transport system involved in multi-copper enzyme maturation permease subunit
VSRRRVGAIFWKELRDYRHNGAIVWSMAVIPLIFSVFPLLEFIALPASAAKGLSHSTPLVYLLGIPALVPAAVAAYSVVGEREQGTLEPVLTTPIRREEFLLGKALAAFAPSVLVSLAVYAIFIACLEVFAHPAVAAAAVSGPSLVAQLVFTPLLAAWSIWLGIAISSRAGDLRVAQSLGMLASFPSVAVTTLIALGKIPATTGLAVALAVILLILDGFGWRFVAAIFDRERLVTGTRS